MIPENLKKIMQKQGYHFVGNHSAIKICEYTANALRGRESCYKSKFYGIDTARCMQTSLSIGCDLSCRFCWRMIPDEINIKWNELNAVEPDDPDLIINGFLDEQRRIVSGYKSGGDIEIWRRANHPVHVAISLTGESLFYRRINEIILSFHAHGISTFIVSNGTLPEVIEKLEPPTQFYISLQAPNKELYMLVTRPKLKSSWQRFLKSLKIMRSIKTRTALRMSLIKGLNMSDPEGYAELIKLAMPMYIEVKGFSFVGGARNPSRNLHYEDMPSHKEVKEFAELIAKHTGYKVSNEHEKSRIVLLSRDDDAEKNAKINFKELYRSSSDKTYK